MLNYTLVVLLMAELRREFERERKLARFDQLTGALSGRAFRDLLDREVARASRGRKARTLAYLDSENFKQVNDRLGHGAGDEVPRVFAAAAHRQLQPRQVLARGGSDEFLSADALMFEAKRAGKARLHVETLDQAPARLLSSFLAPSSP